MSRHTLAFLEMPRSFSGNTNEEYRLEDDISLSWVIMPAGLNFVLPAILLNTSHTEIEAWRDHQE